ncbi:MAG: hypothetical protein M1825_001400 [Sarcosagium campestre]|nr:MAG: hypothetical protein M1825_001400 [Sarcosagium campestre]
MIWPFLAGLLMSTAGLWLHQVNAIVSRPYLDEVFHVKQAQAYCNHQWRVWDPKLTTPPGLYIATALLSGLFGRCDLDFLRLLNLTVHAVGTFLVTRRIYNVIHKPLQSDTRGHGASASKPWSEKLVAEHVALNIFLFPVLFFLSALYYTDVISTFFVLLAYDVFLELPQTSWQRDAAIVILGLISLSFRQTNIFWVCVFQGGLAVIRTLETNTSRPESGEHRPTFPTIMRRAWKHAQLYDLPAEDAYVEDYLKSTASVLIASLVRFKTVSRAIVPYVVLLSLFGGFVMWNGGVVLVYTLVPTWIRERIIIKSSSDLNSDLNTRSVTFLRPSSFPRNHIIIAALGLTLTIIHLNTIVHPFTLADNRHYVFYVFRWVLLRGPLRYLVAPIYLVCAWAVLSKLGGHDSDADTAEGVHDRSNQDSGRSKRSKGRGKSPAATKASKSNTSKNHNNNNKVTFVLVWLVSTSLSVMTAPLVEPRYFIIPWVVWRLHVPPAPTIASTPSGRLFSPSSLWFETLWLATINLVTVYIFLYKDFSWPQEPGLRQRFMW